MRIIRFVAGTCLGVLLVILVLSYAFLSSEGLSARKKPSNFEYAIANFAMGVSIPAEAKKLKNPLAGRTFDSVEVLELHQIVFKVKHRVQKPAGIPRN